MGTIDVNSDLGEGFGSWRLVEDAALLDVVSSANVACGFHAGDPVIMRQVCHDAVLRGVAIGAHVGYRDLNGFGRRFVDVDAETLRSEVLYQIAALDGMARVAGSRVRYVKPHGALYNAVVKNEAQAGAVTAAVREYDPSLVALGLPGSSWLRLAGEAGLETTVEAFADRAYTPTGELVSRRLAGAVITDPQLVADRAVAMAVGEAIEDVNGEPLLIRPDSICVHGDTAHAVEGAGLVRRRLEAAGVQVTPFVR